MRNRQHFTLTIAFMLFASFCVFTEGSEGPPPIIGTAVMCPPRPGQENWSIEVAIPRVSANAVKEWNEREDWHRTLKLPISDSKESDVAADSHGRVVNSKGKRLSIDEIRENLGTGKKAVLVSLSGRMPDQLYIQLAKRDTLIIVLEGDAAAANVKAAEGILKFYPQDVKSVQAWLGHEFVVGETPIRPTDAVSSQALRRMVGKKVRVEGVWKSGETVDQANSDDEAVLQNLSFPLGQSAVSRDAGIEAASLMEIE